jgi:acid phosphatase type 7
MTRQHGHRHASSLRRMAAMGATLGVMTFLSACSEPEKTPAPELPAAPSASACNGTEQAASRLFLQQVSSGGAIIKWRGDATQLCAGTSREALDISIDASETEGHKLATLGGLQPDTVYYYSLGGAASADPSRWFRTAPERGNSPGDGNIHIWLLGDSGTETEEFRGIASHKGEARAVKEGFLRYNREQAGDEPLDLLLLLGDNAYLQGSDEQWQGAFFDIYPEILGNVATWPTIGNHEMGVAPLDICTLAPMPDCAEGPKIIMLGGVSDSSDPLSYDSDGDGPDASGFPYFNIFSLPTAGEMGGVPSGTEQYYSFDYGNVHIVSLDSQLSNRDPAQRAAMRDWLIDDLGRNDNDWTVVIFHHPPYSKGMNHDSDVEQAEIDMRTTFGPVFQDYGVDVVYSGHAHSYERSWYLHGHFGPSDTFDATLHAEQDASGKPALGHGDAPYAQISPASQADDKVVYAVAGSAGKADSAKPCAPGQTLMCSDETWLTHPAHRSFAADSPAHRPNGLALKGSVVLDVGAKSLTSRFVDEHGSVLDHFVITRD